MAMIRESDNAPLISVVVTTYNGEKYIREQLNSIYAQDYANFEVLVSDDGSSDATLEVLKEFESKGNFKWWQNASNLGYVKNFEYVISRAQSGFIALCDQDDIWYPYKLTELYAQMVSSGSWLIYSDADLVDKCGNKIGSKLIERFPIAAIQGGDYKKFYLRNTVNGCTALVTKELFLAAAPFPSKVPHDRWLAYVAAKANKLQYVDKPLLGYRMHDSNTAGVSYSIKLSNWLGYFNKKLEVYSWVFIKSKFLRPKRINQEYIDYLDAFLQYETKKGGETDLLRELKSWAEERMQGGHDLKSYRPLFERNSEQLGFRVRRLLFVSAKREQVRAVLKLFYKMAIIPLILLALLGLVLKASNL